MHNFCSTKRLSVAQAAAITYSARMPQNKDIEGLFQEAESLRRGLRPLSIHVSTALFEYAKRGVASDDILRAMTGMIEGVKRYQEHPYRRVPAPLETVWRQGQASLLYCPADKKADDAPVMFLVPSMINRSMILDLLPGRSYVRWLAAQGYEVYLLDWGDPARDPGMNSLDQVIGDVMLAAADVIRIRAGERSLFGLGYCMGATLLAAAGVLRPELFSRLVFLAGPWDFCAGDRVLGNYIVGAAPSALQMINSTGCLPVDWVQSIFAAVNADRTGRKFTDFSIMDQDSEAARLFVVLEDWLNDGVDLPGEVARTCILGWYTYNTTFHGKWAVGGTVIAPARIKTPSLIVASARDRLVPAESSLALAAQIPGSATLKPESGHIGMITGRRAAAEVWQPVHAWLIDGRR